MIKIEAQTLIEQLSAELHCVQVEWKNATFTASLNNCPLYETLRLYKFRTPWVMFGRLQNVAVVLIREELVNSDAPVSNCKKNRHKV